MISILFYSVFSVLLVSLISLIGLLTLAVKLDRLKKILIYFVSFSTGALLGDVFIHLLPESVENNGFGLGISLSVLLGVIVFFILEKIVHWRHCHAVSCEAHPKSFVYMNLIGDGLHNFIDGAIITASYFASIPIGIATTLAVLFHEIPQEIGDFGVLIHGGFSRKKALALNFLTAFAAVIGAVVTYWLWGFVGGLAELLIPVAAGGFIYIAGSDLIPELHRELKPLKSLLQIAFILLGIGVMLLLG